MLSQMHILAKAKDTKVPKRDEKARQIRSYNKYYQCLVKEHRRQSNYLEAAEVNLEDKFILKQVKKKIASIKGIAEKSGIILLYLFLKYPNASRQQMTALCGLDPPPYKEVDMAD